jgi:hypothetical protein
VRLREAGGLLDLLVGRAGGAEGDVLAHRRREEEGVLGDDRDRPAERGELHLADVDAVHQDATPGRVVEAGDESRERRLPRAGVPDDRHALPRLDLEVDVLEHRPLRVVAEGRVLEADPAAAFRELAGAVGVGDLLGLVEDLEDALAGGRRAL